jgi:hypothetical protein
MMKYQIVVPSRGRPQNCQTLLSLMPDACICVDEREAKDYAPHVPKKQLLLHPPTRGAPAARNWIIKSTLAPCLIMSDDDLVGVRSNVGSKRFITDPDEVMSIIENAVTCCADLKLSTFCWSRTANTTVIRPDERPIVPTQQVYGIWGMMNKARQRLYDESLISRADLDWTMRTLLEDRVVYADIRYYFDFGRSFSGAGGQSGLVTPDDFKRSTEIVAKRWGRSISFKRPGWMKTGETVAGVPHVKRQSSMAKGK